MVCAMICTDDQGPPMVRNPPGIHYRLTCDLLRPPYSSVCVVGTTIILAFASVTSVPPAHCLATTLAADVCVVDGPTEQLEPLCLP